MVIIRVSVCAYIWLQLTVVLCHRDIYNNFMEKVDSVPYLSATANIYVLVHHNHLEHGVDIVKQIQSANSRKRNIIVLVTKAITNDRLNDLLNHLKDRKITDSDPAITNGGQGSLVDTPAVWYLHMDNFGPFRDEMEGISGNRVPAGTVKLEQLKRATEVYGFVNAAGYRKIKADFFPNGRIDPKDQLDMYIKISNELSPETGSPMENRYLDWYHKMAEMISANNRSRFQGGPNDARTNILQAFHNIPGQTKIERFPWPNGYDENNWDKCDWEKFDAEDSYNPIKWIEPLVFDNRFDWADKPIEGEQTEMVDEKGGKKQVFVQQRFWWNAKDGNINRKAHVFPYLVTINGYPLNPLGPTSVANQGKLGKWGVNSAGDAFVVKASDLPADHSKKSICDDVTEGCKHLECYDIATELRLYGGKKGVPGGMIDNKKTAEYTIFHEFMEEYFYWNEEARKNEKLLVEKALDYAIEFADLALDPNTNLTGPAPEPNPNEDLHIIVKAVLVRKIILMQDLRVKLGVLQKVLQGEWTLYDESMTVLELIYSGKLVESLKKHTGVKSKAEIIQDTVEFSQLPKMNPSDSASGHKTIKEIFAEATQHLQAIHQLEQSMDAFKRLLEEQLNPVDKQDATKIYELKKMVTKRMNLDSTNTNIQHLTVDLPNFISGKTFSRWSALLINRIFEIQVELLAMKKNIPEFTQLYAKAIRLPTPLFKDQVDDGRNGDHNFMQTVADAIFCPINLAQYIEKHRSRSPHTEALKSIWENAAYYDPANAAKKERHGELFASHKQFFINFSKNVKDGLYCAPLGNGPSVYEKIKSKV